MDLLNIKPHKVSTDLSGYITFIYGAPKTGKTTLATQMPKCLLLAFEQGYNALPGVIAQDITSWGEMKQVYRELKKPEVKEAFNAVIVDTIDIAADYCQKYVCNQKGIETLSDLGYGKGWSAFKDEFNDVFRGLTRLGYAVFFIGHAKEQSIDNNDGTDNSHMVIRPALSNSTRGVIEGMADIYGYAHQKSAGKMSVLTLRCGDDSIACGGRIKYLPDEIEMSYENLVNAMRDAIEKEAKEHDGKFITDERMTVAPEAPEYNYDELKEEFNIMVSKMMEKTQDVGPKITAIVNKYLGRGKTVKESTPEQAELLFLINEEIKSDLFNKI